MAVLIRNVVAVNAGTQTSGSSITINRIRIKPSGAPNAAAAILDLDAAVTVANNQQFELAANAIQITFKSGPYGDGFMNYWADLLFGNSTDGFTNFEVDFISGAAATAPVAASTGITQQTWNNFSFSNPAD